MRYYGLLKGYYEKYMPSSSFSNNSLLGSVLNIVKPTVANKYNINLSEKGLDEYVTKKSINGLFYIMSKEEEKIRANPLKAVSGIVKKVFSRYR